MSVSGSGPWGAFHSHQCEKRAVVTRNGKRYCKIHDPEYVKAKGEERTKRWEAQHKADRIAHSGTYLLGICKKVMETTHDFESKKILADAIAKVEGD